MNILENKFLESHPSSNFFDYKFVFKKKIIYPFLFCKHPLIEFLRHPIERGCGQPFSPTESLSLHRRKADCELLASQLNESVGLSLDIRG